MKSPDSPSFMQRSSPDSGNVTVVVLGIMAVLSMLVGSVLTKTLKTYRHVSHIASWQEAILAAEAGADIAMAELRKTLIDPSTAFENWTTTDVNGNPLPLQGRRYTVPTLSRTGEGSRSLDAQVFMDSPPELLDGDYQWVRIRATGTTYLPGTAYNTNDKRDNALRRFSFIQNWRTNTPVTRPQATRMIELVAKPVGLEDAIVSNEPIVLNNHKITVDSYDSRYPTKSTLGLYDPAKMQKNGDIATNSQLINAGNATIYGDALTNAGVITNAAHISGQQRNDYYKELIPIKKPNWTTFDGTINNIASTTTLVGGTKANPKRYKINRMSINGTDKLTILPPATGGEGYVEIWLTGDFATTGSGSIVVAPYANLKIFVEGAMDIKGNGTFNEKSQPKRLQILGVQPQTTPPPRFYISGNGVFVGAIYAPGHPIEFGSTGSNGTYWGALVGKSISMGGSSTIHYDEALADQAHITDFRIQSWFEDNR